VVRRQEHVRLIAVDFRWAGVMCALLGAACQGEPPKPLEERAQGMSPAKLDLPTQTAVFEASLGKSFDLGPGMLLRLHPRRLPRTGGFDGGDAVDPAFVAALLKAGLIRGTCDPVRDGEFRAPRCDDTSAGYVVRASDMFQRDGDTLQMYLHAEVFAPLKGPGTSPFDFEMAYRLVPRGDGRFRVVSEGRVRQKQ
jgi:hypothetical protein